MTVDGLVNVQRGETFQEYHIEHFIKIYIYKNIERIFRTNYYHLQFYITQNTPKPKR